MKSAPFEYCRAASVAEACALLATHGDSAKLIAGGQSLVPMMAMRLLRPAWLIDINEIAALKFVALEADAARTGACTRQVVLERDDALAAKVPLLRMALACVGHVQTRNRGTVGGSLAHADPSSEWCLVAATLGAQMIALSTRGARTIAAEDYFSGIMTTALAEDELLAQVRIPLLAPDTRFGFREFSRRAGDYAIAMALVTFRLDGGTILEPRVGVGGAEAHARRIPEAEAALAGKPAELATFRAAAEIAADVIDPMEDMQADATYRRDLVRAMTRRALEHAAQ